MVLNKSNISYETIKKNKTLEGFFGGEEKEESSDED